MALLKDMVQRGAELDLDSGASLHVVARKLREAGKVSKSGRGPSAAHMIPLDGSSFLIACAATDKPDHVVAAEQAFGDIGMYKASPAVGDDCPLSFPVGTRLRDALAESLEALGNGAIGDAFLVVRRSQLGATLGINGAQFAFRSAGLQAIVEAIKDQREHDSAILQYDEEALPFRSGKNITAELRYPLLKAFADLIAGKAAS